MTWNTCALSKWRVNGSACLFFRWWLEAIDGLNIWLCHLICVPVFQMRMINCWCVRYFGLFVDMCTCFSDMDEKMLKCQVFGFVSWCVYLFFRWRWEAVDGSDIWLCQLMCVPVFQMTMRSCWWVGYLALSSVSLLWPSQRQKWPCSVPLSSSVQVLCLLQRFYPLSPHTHTLTLCNNFVRCL